MLLNPDDQEENKNGTSTQNEPAPAEPEQYRAELSPVLDERRLVVRRPQEMRVLYETSLEINAQLDLSTLLQAILQRATRLLGTQLANLFLLKSDGRTLEIVADLAHPEKYVGMTIQIGEGVAGRVAQTGEPLWIADYRNWEGRTNAIKISVGRILGAPLRRGESIVGVLIVFDKEPGQFVQDDVWLLNLFAAQAAIAIENARLYAEAQQRLKEQTALQKVSAIISSTLELGALLAGIVEQMGQVMDVSSVYILSYEPETTISVVLAEYLSPQAQPQERISDLNIAYNLVRDCPNVFNILMSGQVGSLYLDNPHLSEFEQAHMQQYGVQSILVIPLSVGGRIIAFAELWESRQQRVFTGQEIRLCEAIAQQAAIAIENVRLHEQTQKHAQQVQQILDTVQEGILLLDSNYSVKLANPLAQTYLGLLAGITVGEVLTHLGGIPLQEIFFSINKNGWRDIVFGGSRPRIFEVAIRSTALNSVVEGWVMILRDVTKERDIQTRAQQQDRLAAVGQLAAGIAHDFNNILTSIIGYTELALMDLNLSELTKADLGRIVRQSQRAAHLVRQILDFSRQSLAERRELDLIPLVKEAIKMLERVIPENIRLVLEIEPSDHPYLLRADPAQIQEALTNLTLNARDAMPTGGTLSYRLSMIVVTAGKPHPSPDILPGNWILLSVSDTGVGIPSELQSRIFEPFFTTKEVGQGTGLGLAQVYGIVKQHEGQIEVESQVGQGTTFTFYFPLLTPAPGSLHPNHALLPQGQGQVILLVEDDETVLDVTRFMLEYLGYRVLTAANGRDALAIFDQQQNEIALVLTDVTMPEIGGLVLAQMLRQRKATVKVLILTGYPLGVEARQFLAQGTVAWLQKPLNMMQVAQAVSQLLQAP